MASSAPRWSRLVRFISPSSGASTFADALAPITSTTASVRARVISGDPLSSSYSVTNEEVEISAKDLKSPLGSKDIPIIRMVGLNYALHVAEAKMPTPTSPPMFVKPRTAAGAPFGPVPVPKLAQVFTDGQPAQLDYEGELVIVIGKDCKDVSAEEARNFIAGYAVGNDVSCRKWQMSNGTQWSFSKGFDGWAPFGPCITREELVDPNALRIQTFVNSSPRQDSTTTDFVYDVSAVVAFFSQGTTLEAGTLIFTGTPSGVILGMEEPKPWLKDGDEVEVRIEGLGVISNQMKYL